MLFCHLFFFKINFFIKFFQEYHPSDKQFGSRQAGRSVGPDLDPNRLQRLSADNTSRQRVKARLHKQMFAISTKIS